MDEMDELVLICGLIVEYASSIPPLPEPKATRRLDQPRLRKLRTRLDHQPTAKEIDVVFHECYPEAVELATGMPSPIVLNNTSNHVLTTYSFLDRLFGKRHFATHY